MQTWLIRQLCSGPSRGCGIGNRRRSGRRRGSEDGPPLTDDTTTEHADVDRSLPPVRGN